jgi:nucleoside-diphosphate-sugar epimerase
MNSTDRSLLVLGCGYLGARLARIASASNWNVDVLTRNPDTCEAMKLHCGVRNAYPALLQGRDWHARFSADAYSAIAITVGSASSDPGGYRLSYLEGLESAIEWMQDYPGPLLYTSSISVYGNADGGWFDESSPTQPENWRGEIILESEKLLLEQSRAQATAFRLGGIYGPERSRFLTSLNVLPGSLEDGFLNLIHVEDAASALLKACEGQPTRIPAILNLTDNNPLLRSEIASRLNPAPPPSVPSIPRRNPGVNRRINSRMVQKVLGWKPRHSSCLECSTDDQRPNLA